MADDINENPLENIRNRADELGLDGDERDDWIEARMRRAGFKKGPGEWIGVDEEDDSPRDDDDKPVTRGEWRRMQRENRRKAVSNNSGGAKKITPKKQEEPATKPDTWWR